MTAVDWKTGDFHEVMEPYQTINEQRHLKGIGGIFGIYLQLDIMSKDFFGFQFKQKRLKDPKINLGDTLCLRVKNRAYNVEPPKM